MLSRLSIARQFSALALFAIALTAAALWTGVKLSYDLALQNREAGVRSLVDVAISQTRVYLALAAAGKMSTADAQKAALAQIGAARFDHGNYYYVYAYDGTILQHFRKDFIGQNQYLFKDSYGNYLEKTVLDSARDGHPQFAFYYRVRPGNDVPSPKVGYGEAVPEWGWVVGSGVYIDDLQASVRSEERTLGEIFIPLFAVFLALALTMRRSIGRLLGGIAAAMDEGASAEIPGLTRRDELGRMAARVAAFRTAAAEKRAVEAHVAAARQQAEAAMAARESERSAAAAAQAQLAAALAGALSKLAAGDLAMRLTEVFAEPTYEAMRRDFNAAVAALAETIAVVTTTASSIGGSAGEIAGAADELSRRTEQQAAAISKTAVALNEISTTTAKTAAAASAARSAIATARADAQNSGAVVTDTIAAMSGIEGSARQISNIIGVIDEIAFQTNLLALNAGVEAARAGDAGRGFAVVATEVRALAQRSADAAKEIKALISASGAQVESGVKLVGATGTALTRIMTHIGEVADMVSEIATSAQAQSAGLGAVTKTVAQMDQVTQANAAMVEQTRTATHALAGETGNLKTLLSRFATGAASARLPTPAKRRVPA